MDSSNGRAAQLTLLQERSAGTFARVYLAEARGGDGIDRIVAVKVMKEQWADAEELLTRTRDEARLLARLRHKNILRVEALTEIDGQPAIVMEFVDGVDLKMLMEHLTARGEKIPARAAYRVAADTASALEAAWFKAPYGMSEPLRVVHRDVKPSNVMVSVEGEVKVLDFGTARFNHEARVAQTGVLRFGSMKYMSPERRLGDRGDHSSDCYGLGLLLIELLQGVAVPLLPLDRGDHDEAVRERVAALGPLALPNHEWEEALRETLRRLCAFDATERLDAGQARELFRAFADQARGPSLEAWAASTVQGVARELWGHEGEGALSGSRLFVSLGGGAESSGPSAPAVARPAATPATAAFDDDDDDDDDDAGSGANGGDTAAMLDQATRVLIRAPAGRGLVAVAPEPAPAKPAARAGDRREPAPVRPAEPPARAASPAPAETNVGDGVFDEGEDPFARPLPAAPPPMAAPTPLDPPTATRPGTGRRAAAADDDIYGLVADTTHPAAEPPRPLARPAAEAQWATIGRMTEPRAPTPTAPAAPRGPPRATVIEPPAPAAPAPAPRNYLVIGAAIGGLLLLGIALLGAAGAGLWWWTGRSRAPVAEGGSAAPAAAPSAAAVEVSVEAGTDTLQWVKLEAADGATILKASPRANAAIAPGTYTVRAKQVGRGVQSGPWTVRGPAALRCTVDAKNRVSCADDVGASFALDP